MGDKDLNEFVKDALSGGKSREEIEAVLMDAGWPSERVHAALSAYADVDFAIPVPRPRSYVSAREAFLYLLTFATLGFSAFHIGSLLFQIIDISFPDPASPFRPKAWFESHIRWSISTLVVTFPLYLFLSYKIAKEVAKEPEKRASRVRKWLTYLTLFVAGLFIIGDVISLIYQFLSGTLTIRVGLKILTVGGIAGMVFAYYLRSQAEDERGKEK